MHRTVAFLLCLFLLASPVAHAQEALFSTETEVDKMGQDPVIAKEEGGHIAEKQGLNALLEKFAPDLQEGIVGTLDAKSISALVHSREVLSESLDGNRYRATLRLHFYASKLNALIEERLKALQADQIMQQPSTLIFPIFVMGEKTMLFEPKNIWRKAWIDSGISHRSGTLILPYGDMNDMVTITAEKAIKQEYKDFGHILRRYGVRDVMVAVAELTGPEKKRELRVVLRRVQATKEDITHYTFPADTDVDDVTLMQQACAALASQIQDAQSATQNAINNKDKKGGVQLIVVGVKSPKDYVFFRKKLEGLKQVDKVDVVAFSANQADFNVYYHSPVEQLQEAIKALKVRLTILPNYWTIEEAAK
jgi:hypothetical protein